MKKCVLWAMLAMAPLWLSGQKSELGNWLIYFGNKQISEKWNWHHEVQYRNYDLIGDLEQLLLRTGVGLNLSENNNNLLAGYAYIHSGNYLPGGEEKTYVSEHRIYQQFISKQHFGRFHIQHRYRFEQRFVEDDFKMRFRYFLSMNIPLHHGALSDRTFYFSAYNEIFLSTESPVFDRNRLYGGLGYKLGPRLRFELGYMNQFFERSGRDQLNMICFASF